MGLFELRMDDEGNLTLDGEIVQGEAMGRPILGYYPGKIENNEIVGSNTNIPSAGVGEYRFIRDANAYLLSDNEFPQIQQAGERAAQIRILRAAQFYKIPSWCLE